MPGRASEWLSAQERDTFDPELSPRLLDLRGELIDPDLTTALNGSISGLQQPGHRRGHPWTQTANRRPGPSASVQEESPGQHASIVQRPASKVASSGSSPPSGPASPRMLPKLHPLVK